MKIMIMIWQIWNQKYEGEYLCSILKERPYEVLLEKSIDENLKKWVIKLVASQFSIHIRIV